MTTTRRGGKTEKFERRARIVIGRKIIINTNATRRTARHGNVLTSNAKAAGKLATADARVVTRRLRSTGGSGGGGGGGAHTRVAAAAAAPSGTVPETSRNASPLLAVPRVARSSSPWAGRRWREGAQCRLPRPARSRHDHNRGR